MTTIQRRQRPFNDGYGRCLKLVVMGLLAFMTTGCLPGNRVPLSVDKMIVGEVEPVTIKKAGITMSARIDTGAQTSSLGAENIILFERDGKRWVKFTINDTRVKKKVEIDCKLVRITSIKRHGGPSIERPVVKLQAILGTVEQSIEFSLADRSSFEYPILIGRNFLNGKYIVDVSRKNSKSPMNEEGKDEN